jgi:hypothetical protein
MRKVIRRLAVLVVPIVALLAVPAAQAASWETRTPSGPNRQEVSYVKAGWKLYLAGGLNTAQEAYDPATNSWSNVAPLPATLDHIQSVELNGLIYYIGGLINWPSPQVSTVYIYNPTTNTFSQGAPMPRGRGAGGVAVYNGKIYYAGGLNNGVAVPWFDVYDPVANTWSQLPDMPRVRDHFHAAVVNGKFYAIGGRNVSIDATTAANDVYNFATGSWAPGLAPLPTARGGFATAVMGNEVIIIGGEGGGLTYHEVEAYNTTLNTWRTLPPMPTARHGIQAAVCNGGIYIAAGGTVQSSGGATDVHEVFFPNGPSTCAPPTPYPHPQSASPISVPLVPVFKQCSGPGSPGNGSHAPPLGSPSCVPPQRKLGNAAHYGSSSQGSTTMTVVAGDSDPTNGDQADVAISVHLSDVTTAAGGDYDPNPSGADLTEATRLRLTDHNNNGGASGTTTDFDFSAPVNCVATGGPQGSSCDASTSADAVMPEAIQEDRGTVAEVFRVRLFDSGPNGVREDGAGDDSIFAQQGIYAP